jgi:hypothetical protein
MMFTRVAASVEVIAHGKAHLCGEHDLELMPRSGASFTIFVVASWPRFPMFMRPPNCIVPSATSLTMTPVFPNRRYFMFSP